jgi:hypothetical protein
MQSYLQALTLAPPGTLRVRYERCNIDLPIQGGQFYAGTVGVRNEIMRLTPNSATIVENLDWATQLSQDGFLQGLPLSSVDDLSIQFERDQTSSTVNYGKLRLLNYGVIPTAVVIIGRDNTTNEGEKLFLRVRGALGVGPDATSQGATELKLRFNFRITEVTDMKFARKLLEGVG